ncbi:hypothetical protein DFH09DRAFT_1305911 [Mycena vulgaris]|nr:hypothetical protein DFH09DRAFT_1305911 [Mycena vulgaris]
MQGINSAENIDQVYLAAVEIVKSQLPVAQAQEAQSIQSSTSPATYVSVRGILTRSLWGHLQGRVRGISTKSGQRGQRDLDDDLKMESVAIIQHPFLIDCEPDISAVTNVKSECSLIQHSLDEAYASTLDFIARFCLEDRDGRRAYALVAALKTLLTFPDHLLSAEHHQDVMDGLLCILAHIKTSAEMIYSSVMALFPPALDWFTNVSKWADKSEGRRNTIVLFEALEIYSYEYRASQDARFVRAVQLRNYFENLLPNRREPVRNPERYRRAMHGENAAHGSSPVVPMEDGNATVYGASSNGTTG